VVVGVDGSANSKDALRAAYRLAQALRVRLEVLMCWEDSLFDEGFYGAAVSVDPEAFRITADQRLQAVLAEVFGPHLPEDIAPVLLRGRTADLLIDASRQAQLLVVGRRGVGGVLGLLVGSVTNACVSHAHCPVLVVRH